MVDAGLADSFGGFEPGALLTVLPLLQQHHGGEGTALRAASPRGGLGWSPFVSLGLARNYL
jgi:hypothetical protein